MNIRFVLFVLKIFIFFILIVVLFELPFCDLFWRMNPETIILFIFLSVMLFSTEWCLIINDLLDVIKKILLRIIATDRVSNNSFFEDKPISQNKEDELDRDDIVKILLEIIKSTSSYSECVRICVSGKWGEGKTSVLNLVKNKLIISLKHKILDFLENLERVHTN